MTAPGWFRSGAMTIPKAIRIKAGLRTLGTWIGAVSRYAWLPALILSGVSAYYAHENFSLQVQRNTSVKQVREDLGDFAQRGVMLFAQCVHAASPSPQAEVDEWDKQLEAYLRLKLGDAYRARMLALRPPIGSFPFVSGDRANLCGGLSRMLVNLDVIISEFSGSRTP
jgi:hypothetical protein